MFGGSVPEGKFCSLATNCSKHILAEMKAAHRQDLEGLRQSKQNGRSASSSGSKQKMECIGKLLPPNWMPQEFKSLDDLNESAPSGDNAIQDEAADEIGPAHRLLAMLNEVELFEGQDRSSSSRQKRKPEDIINDLDPLGLTAGEEAYIAANKKQVRGNHGFFKFLATIRRTENHLPDEIPADFEKRVRSIAQARWKEWNLVASFDTGVFA